MPDVASDEELAQRAVVGAGQALSVIVLHWLQRMIPPAYALAMRVANSRFDRLASRAR